MARMKIVIPRDVPGQLSLASDIFKQHKKLGNGSPLNVLKVKTIETTISKANELDKEAARLNKQLERIYAQRDKQMPKIKNYILKSRDVLKGVNRGDLTALGAFGFEVNVSKK